MPKWGAAIGPAVVAAALAALVLAVAAAHLTAARERSASVGALQAGRLVRLEDGRRLNLRCFGRGAPTVLFESGFAADSSAWRHVQAIVARHVRTCSYDRAGYGFSDPGPLPRDGDAIARDLDRALTAGRIEGPFILVGHSAGGLYQRLFAARRRADIVGMVFVDTSVEFQPQRLTAVLGRPVAGAQSLRRKPERCLAASLAVRGGAAPALLADCIPPRADPRGQALAHEPSFWRTEVSELDNLFTTTSIEVGRTRGLLRDIPAVVLTAADQDGGAADLSQPVAMAWQGFHVRLAAEFRGGVQRNVRSSHLMMKDRPGVVADAVLGLVAQARREDPRLAHRFGVAQQAR